MKAMRPAKQAAAEKKEATMRGKLWKLYRESKDKYKPAITLDDNGSAH